MLNKLKAQGRDVLDGKMWSICKSMMLGWKKAGRPMELAEAYEDYLLYRAHYNKPGTALCRTDYARAHGEAMRIYRRTNASTLAIPFETGFACDEEEGSASEDDEYYEGSASEDDEYYEGSACEVDEGVATDAWSTLGIERFEHGSEAGLQEVRRAYKMQARIHHPDKGGDPEKFRALTIAYKTLLKHF